MKWFWTKVFWDESVFWMKVFLDESVFGRVFFRIWMKVYLTKRQDPHQQSKEIREICQEQQQKHDARAPLIARKEKTSFEQ